VVDDKVDDEVAAMRSQALDELRAIWTRFGRPSLREMAARTGVRPARFAFLAEHAAAWPDVADVRDLLTAVGESQTVIGQWERTWRYLETAAGSDLDALGEPEEDGPLGKALKARTPDEFVAQLRALKARAQRSFEDIAKASGNRLPKSTGHWMLKRGNFPARAEQVSDFVKACGVTNLAEAQLWLTAYARAQGRHRVHMTVAGTSPDAGDDLPRFLESVGDDLAARGQLQEAIAAYKEALAHHRNLSSDAGEGG
jgi:hypothetical protein